jgi:hypothetical protein
VSELHTSILGIVNFFIKKKTLLNIFLLLLLIFPWNSAAMPHQVGVVALYIKHPSYFEQLNPFEWNF